MNNSTINYEDVIINDVQLPDYMSKKYFMIAQMEELNDETYITYYQLLDDEKIETISYKFYDTPDYWDLILLINNMSPLMDMIYNFDVVEEESIKKIDFYAENVYVTKDLPEGFVDSMKVDDLNNTLTLLEENRTIKIIKPGALQSFLKILREKGYV